MIAKTLARLGFARKSEPIINDGRGNRPTVTVRYGGGYTPGTSWGWNTTGEMVRAGYGENSDVYACVSLVAQAAKQIKWETDSRSLESLRLLYGAGGPTLIESWISSVMLTGNSFLEVGRSGRGRPIDPPNSVYLLSPATIRYDAADNPPRQTEKDLVRMWGSVNGKGMPRAIEPADMIHSKLFNPFDPVFGMAPLQAAMLRVQAENEGAALMSQILGRGHSPGWIEAAKDSIWEESQITALKERIKHSKQRGEELFLENAVWHQMGFPPAESGVAEGHVLSKRDIASVFHVDPALIGDTTGRTYATYRESRQALYMEAVIPLLSEFIHDWNEAIGLPFGSPLALDKNELDAIADTRGAISDRVIKLFGVGLVTQNEAREELRYERVAGGDVFYAPANVMPLDGRGEDDAAAAVVEDEPKGMEQLLDEHELDLIRRYPDSAAAQSVLQKWAGVRAAVKKAFAGVDAL